MSCEGGANPFVDRWFHDCLYSLSDYIGFAAGLVSIACWLVAQLPQLIENARTQNIEALSPFFLAEWLLGDTCNLIGCILTGSQLPTQLYSAMYFICIDVVLVMQYIYYGSLQRRRQRISGGASRSRSRDTQDSVVAGGLLSDRQAGRSRVVAFAAMLFCCTSTLAGLSQGPAGLLPQPVLQQSSRQLLTAGQIGHMHWHESWSQQIGNALGYASCLFYLGSRISQIAKNFRRKSAEGLAIAMFLCAIAANTLYGGGILIRTYDLESFWNSLPWLLGSLGTVGLDVTIYLQFWTYRRRTSEKAKAEARRLLDGEEDA